MRVSYHSLSEFTTGSSEGKKLLLLVEIYAQGMTKQNQHFHILFEIKYSKYLLYLLLSITKLRHKILGLILNTRK
jgi:hypothetical protein